MENNYQEKILDRYHGFEAVKDCFIISRIQGEISVLIMPSMFDKKSGKELIEKYNELNLILSKYPGVVEQIKL